MCLVLQCRNTSGVLMWGPRGRTSIERAQNEPPSSPRRRPCRLRGGGNRAAAAYSLAWPVLDVLGLAVELSCQAAGDALVISIPRTETAVIRHFQERMPYGLFVPEVA